MSPITNTFIVTIFSKPLKGVKKPSGCFILGKKFGTSREKTVSSNSEATDIYLLISDYV